MKILFRMAVPILGFILRFFFDSKYLKGRFFNESIGGYKWALQALWARNILRLGRTYPWPVHLSCYISNPKKIHFDPDDINNFQARGPYFQCFGGDIYIGRGSYIAPNVGIITQNHDFNDLSSHSASADVVIGPECWIGMHSVVLPGVKLGRKTIVGAGSVVTQSFEDGNMIIAGVPAKPIRKL